jgi:hypothetical protein
VKERITRNLNTLTQVQQLKGKVVATTPKQMKVSDKTHERLSRLVEFKGETYDQVINKCIDAYLRELERRGRKGK